MRRLIASIAWTAGLALVGGLLPLWIAAGDLPDIEVRTRPLRAHAGRLLARHPIGQGFRCESEGLWRIEVALASIVLPARGGVELNVRAGGPKGTLLRSSVVRPGVLAPGGELVAFDFEPLMGSAGRALWFDLRPTEDLRPAAYCAYLRTHGQVGHHGVWGTRLHAGPVVEGVLRASQAPEFQPRAGDPLLDEVPHPNLRSVAVAVAEVDPRHGEVRLELWEEGVDGPPVRRVTLAEEDATHSGFVWFSFEPIAESRWKRFRFRITLPEGAALIGDEIGPTMITFHGAQQGHARLLGLSRGSTVTGDRDLVFRAWGARDRLGSLRKMAERAGWRLWAAAALWLTATALLVRHLIVGAAPANSRGRERARW